MNINTGCEFKYVKGVGCVNWDYSLMEMPTNIHSLQTSGLLNSHANRWTSTNVGHLHGDRTSVISLSELNWFTNALAKAKAAAAAEAAKVKAAAAAEAAKVKHAAAAAAAHVKEQLHEDALALKQHLAEDISKAKVAAAHFASLSKEAAKEMIMEASAMAKHEGAKLANQLISDAEAEGHVLDADAKDKILALSIAIGQSASDKVGEVDQKVNDMLEKHRNTFTGGIIDFLEAKGEHLSEQGEAEAVALAAILGQKANDKVDSVDAKIDALLDSKRPAYMLLI